MAVHVHATEAIPTARFDDLDLDRDEARAEWQRRLETRREERPKTHPLVAGVRDTFLDSKPRIRPQGARCIETREFPWPDESPA